MISPAVSGGMVKKESNHLRGKGRDRGAVADIEAMVADPERPRGRLTRDLGGGALECGLVDIDKREVAEAARERNAAADAAGRARGPETLGELTAELGASVKAVTVDEAVKADIILFAVGSLAFKDVGAVLQDWSGKIVIDVTNGFMLPPEVQQAEYQGRLTSEVNAERVPGAKLVKAFNQLPFKVLASPVPDDVGRRVVFVSSDHENASATVAALAESLGFAAIEVGKIAEGGRLIQARAPLVFQNLIKYPL